MPRKGTHSLADIVGKYRYDGPRISTAELCRPVDLREEGSEREGGREKVL
jgi:hypothetical protein